MAREITFFVRSPKAFNVDLVGRFGRRARVLPLEAYVQLEEEREEPVIMVARSTGGEIKVDTSPVERLDSPGAVELQVSDVSELTAGAIEPTVEAADRGDHTLWIVEDDS